MAVDPVVPLPLWRHRHYGAGVSIKLLLLPRPAAPVVGLDFFIAAGKAVEPCPAVESICVVSHRIQRAFRVRHHSGVYDTPAHSRRSRQAGTCRDEMRS